MLKLYQNSANRHFIDLGFGKGIEIVDSKKQIWNYSRILSYSEMGIPI